MDTGFIDIILAMTEAMIEAEAITDRCFMVEIEEDTLHWEAKPEVITVQEADMEDKTSIKIEKSIDNRGSEINLYWPPEDLELHQDLLAGRMKHVSVAYILVILPKTVLRRTLP